jgi:zinc transport system substrate-binding protein
LVTVSILPLATFIEKIAGDDYNVHVLLPPGASPADFTLAPSQLKAIADSEVWFRIGHIGFEFSWRDKIIQVNPEMEVIDLSEGLDLIKNEYADSLQTTSSMHSGGVNPHTWLSPALVKQISMRIFVVLSEMNPKMKDVYQANYQKFVDEIDLLDREIRDALRGYQGRQFISFHPSLSYFARAYGLVQHSLEPGGKEPTPQRMAEVMELAKREDIGVIFIQSDLDREQARVFAEEVDGEIVQMWPLNPDWSQNLREITKNMIEHF